MFQRKAFTYTELMMVVVVAGILFAAGVNNSSDTANAQADRFSLQFDGDVKYATSLSIAEPADPTVLKVDPTNNRYWLAKASAPDTPITHPRTKKPYVVQAGPTGGSSLDRIQIYAASFGSDLMLKFDAFGGTDQPDIARLQFKAGTNNRELAISPIKATTQTYQAFATGMVANSGGVLTGQSTTNNSTMDYVKNGGSVSTLYSFQTAQPTGDTGGITSGQGGTSGTTGGTGGLVGGLGQTVDNTLGGLGI